MTMLPAARLLSGRQTQGTAPAPSVAAAEGTQPKFSSDVNVVNLFVTVRDKQGKIVKDLTKDDFLLDEEGKPQTIKYFSLESNLPLYLGLLVDTSGSQRTVLNDERSASYKFFDQILREDRDLAFVLHFDFEVELLQDFTSSRKDLEKALDQLQISQRLQQRQGQGQGGGGGGGGGGGYPGGGQRPRGGTDLYDAILLASDELMAKQKGRKALVLLTDGVDTGSKSTLFQAIESAQKSDTLVYSVLFEGSESYSPISRGGPGMGGRRGGMGRMPMPGGGGGGGYERGNGKKVLEQIARETGGRFFQVSHSHPIDKIYADIQEDLRSQYSLGYTPDPPTPSGVYKHVHLIANSKIKKDKDLVVVTREGYYGR
jgi:VWFA-related protein